MGERLPDSANFAAEFKALAERDIPDTIPSIYAHGTLEFSGFCTDVGIGQWTPFGGPSELFLAEFINVATRAGFVLGAPTGVNPCDYFLDCLYNELIERRSSYALEVTGPGFGRICSVCVAATAFWLWHKAKTDAKGHAFAESPEIAARADGADVHVTWGPSSGGGIVLFRNKGAKAATNVRLQCANEIGWQPILSPDIVPTLPAGGHFRVNDNSKYGTQDEDGWATTDGQSIAEFVYSLPTKSVTMAVIFLDHLGNEGSRDLRVSSVEWSYKKSKSSYGTTSNSTARPEPEAVESVSPGSKAEQYFADRRPPAQKSDAADL